jgi:G6PDH family F420-dependent oxidoreductase
MVTRFGYKLMSELHSASELLENARDAESAGFGFVAISDHFHPWLSSHEHSPFAWSVLGAIAAGTSRVGIMTAVTCPYRRYHPAIVAQAAATIGCMSGGRFTLGVGSGEDLNEHVVGGRLPSPKERREMLGEAVLAIRTLWRGGTQSFRGRHVHVDRARIYDLPKEPPPIAVAAGGPVGAKLAAEIGDGLVATAPEQKIVAAWRAAGGRGPAYAEVPLCFAPDKQEAIRLAHERFRFGLLGWPVMSVLPDVGGFEAATRAIPQDAVTSAIACGPDVDEHAALVRRYRDAGFDHLILVGVAPDQRAFLDFWKKQLSRVLVA